MNCPAHCCRGFAISIPYETLRDNYRRWKERDPSLDAIVEDVHLIFPMLIPLGRFSTHHPHFPQVKLGGESDYYACKHLGADGLCTIYEDRPALCRDHPGRTACTFPGCDHQATDYAQGKLLNDAPRGLPILKKSYP